jgi:hypothetical protein
MPTKLDLKSSLAETFADIEGKDLRVGKIEIHPKDAEAVEALDGYSMGKLWYAPLEYNEDVPQGQARFWAEVLTLQNAGVFPLQRIQPDRKAPKLSPACKWPGKPEEIDWDHVYLLGWYDHEGTPYLSTWAGDRPRVDVVVFGTGGGLLMPLWDGAVPKGVAFEPVPEGEEPLAYAKSRGGYYAFGWYFAEGIKRKGS